MSSGQQQRPHKKRSNRHRGKSKSEYEYDLLVETKSEYTNQLYSLLCRPVYEGLKEIWNQTKETYNIDIKEGRKPKYTLLEAFQVSLEKIPMWSDEVVMREYERIKQVTQWNDPDDFDNLITAVILSRTKILSHINSNRKMPAIQLKIPNPKNFIHKVYIVTGIELWKTPYYYEDRPEKIKSQYKPILLEKMMELIRRSIDLTIEKFLPVREILKQSFQASQNAEDTGSESGYTSGESNYSNSEEVPPPPPPELGATPVDTISERTEMFSDYNRYSSDDEPKQSLQDILNLNRKNEDDDEDREDRESTRDDREDEDRRDRDDEDRRDRDEETRSVHLKSSNNRISFPENPIMQPTPSEYHPLEARPTSPSPVLRNRTPTPVDPEPLFIEEDSDDDL